MKGETPAKGEKKGAEKVGSKAWFAKHKGAVLGGGAGAVALYAYFRSKSSASGGTSSAAPAAHYVYGGAGGVGPRGPRGAPGAPAPPKRPKKPKKPKCPAGEFWDGKKCRKKGGPPPHHGHHCPPGKHWSIWRHKCVSAKACPKGTHWDHVKWKCVPDHKGGGGPPPGHSSVRVGPLRADIPRRGGIAPAPASTLPTILGMGTRNG